MLSGRHPQPQRIARLHCAGEGGCGDGEELHAGDADRATVRTQDGIKTSPAWTGYQQASRLYLQWAQQFGLLPMQARLLPQLPPATGSKLRVVHGDT